MSLECENGHDRGDAALSSEISSGNSPKTSSDRALLPPSWPGAVTNPAAPGTQPSAHSQPRLRGTVRTLRPSCPTAVRAAGASWQTEEGPRPLVLSRTATLMFPRRPKWAATPLSLLDP